MRPGIFLWFAVFLYSSEGISQHDSTFSHEVELAGDFYFNSDAITNEFFYHFFNGKKIGNSLKDKMSGRLRYINRWGLDLNTSITWNYRPDTLFGKKGLNCFAAFKDRLHADGIFSRDFFNVVFYGNKPYAGEILDLGNFKLNYLAYQQIQFGLNWEKDSAKNTYGIALSLLKGENNMMIDVKRANFFTSPDGKYIDMDVALRSRQTDTAKTGPLAFNGFGLSTDAYISIPYVTWYHDGVLTVQLQDLGFIGWNGRSLSHRLDTSYHYEGLVINDIFDLQESTFPETDPDTIIQNNLSYSKEPYVTVLPAILSINASTYYGKKFVVEKGINYRFLANARPYYYAGFGWNINKAVLLALNASYGGYGRFNAGMEAEFKFAKRFRITLNSFYLAGVAFPSELGGVGAYVSLSGRF